MNDQYEITLDKFNVIKEIGGGTTFVIYLVQDRETCMQYAAEVSINSRVLFTNMIEFMKNYHHPTLVNLTGYSTHDFNGHNNITLITDYVINGSLQNYLKKATLDETSLQIILVGICRGMMFIHEKHYIHRYLKPSNILLDENLFPRISGLTCLTKIEGQSECIQKVDTPIYTAPEIWSRNAPYDYKTDVYAFSFLMFEVVTGLKAFKQIEGLFSLYDELIQGDRPVFTVNIKPSIKSLIEKCWSGDPKERLSFDELFDKLAFNSKYYLDNVDKDKLNAYVESIRN